MPVETPGTAASRSGTSLWFLNGTDTVGGVQLAVTGETGRLVFDLGVVGNPAIVRDRTLFNSFLRARPGSALIDYLRAGMAPLIEGLYQAGDLAPFGSVAAATATFRAHGFALDGYPLVDDHDPADLAVFISHGHDDHMSLLPFVADTVPVLMSEPSARLHGALVAAGAAPASHARVTGLGPTESRAVGDLSVRVVPVDHDIPGCAGVLVTSPTATVAYTGDWRLHGRHPELMQAFARTCQGVDVLLTDASAVHPPGVEIVQCPQVAEREVLPLLDQIAAAAGRGLYCSFHDRNLERHVDVQTVARSHDRTLVVNWRTYAIWQHAAAAGLPCPDVADVAVWDADPIHDERAGWDDSALDDGRPAGRPASGSAGRVVSSADVAADPAAFLCELRRADRARLLDVGAGPTDVYVYLDGYPHGPADPGWRVLETWMQRLGLRFERISSRGHATVPDLAWLVDAVRPGLVIPVHCNHPEDFPAVAAPVRAVDRGEQLAIGHGGTPTLAAAPARLRRTS